MTEIIETIFEFFDDGDAKSALRMAQTALPMLSDEELLALCVRLKREGCFLAFPDLADRLKPSFLTVGNVTQSAAMHAAPPEINSLDYFIIPTLRGASRALEIFVNAHPQLHAMPRIKFDRVVASGDWKEVIGEANQLRDNLPDLKSGIVLHGGAGELRSFMTVTSVVRYDRPWIQCVREPLSAVLSSINHLVNAGTHTYWFSKFNLPWCNGDEVTTASRAEFDPPTITEKIECDIDDCLRRATRVKMDFQIGAPYAAYFGNWTVMDVEDLSEPRVDQGMEFVFDTIGVDPSFRHPCFHEKMHGKLPRFMYNNVATVSAFGFPLIVMLALPGDSLRCRDLKAPPKQELADYFSLMQVQGNEVLAEAGLAGGNCELLVSIDSWAALPQKIRRMLMETGVLQRYFVETMIPRWASNVVAVLNWVAPAEIDSLTQAQRDYVYDIIADDYEAFLKRHPDLADRWRPVMDLEDAPSSATG